jgi:hypothetical protein
MTAPCKRENEYEKKTQPIKESKNTYLLTL